MAFLGITPAHIGSTIGVGVGASATVAAVSAAAGADDKWHELTLGAAGLGLGVASMAAGKYGAKLGAFESLAKGASPAMFAGGIASLATSVGVGTYQLVSDKESFL